MFSVYNALAALTAGIAAGFDTDICIKALEETKSVDGRFEIVNKQPLVIVDYAHTPDGLLNVLKAARELTPKDSNLICMFGCGGDRDATKRPKMGKIAEEAADIVVVTSDNPRSEDPQLIISDILALYQKNSHPDETRFRNFSSPSLARRHVVYKLISTSANEELLREIPHIPFLDLSIVFYLLFDDGDTRFSSLVYNDQAIRWHLGAGELYALAGKNSLSLLPPLLRSMADVMRDMAAERMDEDTSQLFDHLLEEQRSSHPLYVLTNQAEFNGASCILYPGQLKNFADALESDLIVLPSSIHEVLITPDRDNSHYDSLSTMVSQINEEEVLREDRLSDHIYLYSRESGRLSAPGGDSVLIPAR